MSCTTTIFQDAKTGLALPDNLDITYNQRWSPFRQPSDQPGMSACGLLAHWKPGVNLARRVHKRAKKNGYRLVRFRALREDIRDGWVFPTYVSHDINDESKYAVIVLDPDCEERVIYAYGNVL